MKNLRPAIRHYNDLTSFERIAIWYQEDEDRRTVVLTEKEEKLASAYKVTFGLLMDKGDNLTVVNILRRFYKISDATAYKYIREAKRLFCDVENLDKESERFILLKQIERSLAQAQKEKDLQMQEKFMKLKADVLGMTREDAFVPDWSKVQPVLPIIGFFPEMLKTELPPPDELKRELEKLIKPKRKNNLPIEEAKIVIDDTTNRPDEEGSL